MIDPSIIPPAVDPAWVEALRHADCVRVAARAFAARYRGLALDPDDLTQEGMIVAHRIATQYRASLPDSYYAKAAWNRFIDVAWRRPRRRHGSVRLVGLEKAVLAEVPPDRVDAAELAEAEVAIDTLAPRAAFILRHHFRPEAGESLTDSEIGHDLGICRHQVWVIRVRALADLRVALGVTA